MDASEEDLPVAENSQVEDDYYTFLNVSREATNEEINNAYRKLSRLYHPDKHSDPVKKKYAEALFNKTKTAYEVLTDAHKRAIYDNLGIKGLETDGWEVVQRTKTPQEIREEYERLAREREERQLQQRTNPKGAVVCNINATELFDRYDVDEYEPRSFPNFEISGVNISQSIEAPLTLTDTGSLAGQVSTHNGTGSGNLNFSLRRILSSASWSEFEIGAGNGLLCTLRGFRTLSKTCFGNVSATFQYTPLGVRPGFQVLLARQLDKHLVGYLTWKAGLQSCMNTTLVYNGSRQHIILTLQLGVPNSFMLASYTMKFADEFKLKGSIKYGTFGTQVEYGCEKKISRHSILAASIIIALPAAVTLKVRVSRGNQSYIFPILLSEQLMPTPIVYGTFTPLLTWFVMKKLVINPYIEKQKQREIQKQKEASAAKMVEKKKEAEAAVMLMKETVSRLREGEESIRGLIIVKGLYGRFQVSDTRLDNSISSEDGVIEVTVPLQCLVKDSKLILHETSKSQLPGFFDPCVGEEKFLYIQYQFHNLMHEVKIGDTESIRLPKQTHRVQS